MTQPARNSPASTTPMSDSLDRSQRSRESALDRGRELAGCVRVVHGSSEGTHTSISQRDTLLRITPQIYGVNHPANLRSKITPQIYGVKCKQQFLR